MELKYDIDGVEVEICIKPNQFKNAIIDAVIRETMCTEEQANAFFDIAKKLQLELDVIFDEELREYFEDIVQIAFEKTIEDEKNESEQMLKDYYKSCL